MSSGNDQRPNRDRTTAELVAAARSRVEQQPYESIRVRDIADAVGCNHGLITHYFGSKRGLFSVVLTKMRDELVELISSPGSARDVFDHPTTASFWRLLASLLDAGLDPADALGETLPAVETLVRRAAEMSGRDVRDSRQIAGFVILMVGGYHVFGDVLAPVVRPTGEPSDAAEGFERILSMLLASLAEPSSAPSG